MLEYLRNQQYQRGQRDRDAGLLPKMESSIYMDGYRKDRSEGLDGIVQYFPTVVVPEMEMRSRLSTIRLISFDVSNPGCVMKKHHTSSLV